MARLTRVRQKVFASNASNNGVFGSLQAGNPTTSNDVATLQSLSAFENGWDDAAYSGDKLPPLEEFQGIQYGISYQQAYMLQEGIAEWDANTPYYKGSLAKTISGTSFKLYCSIADNNTNKAVTNTSYWTKVMDSDDLYAFDSSVVHLAGAETITGAKTFTSSTYISGSNKQLFIKATNITRNTAPSSNINNVFVDGVDSAGKSLWGIYNRWYTTKQNEALLIAYKGTTTDNSWAGIGVGYDSSGNAYTLSTVQPSDTTTTSGTQLATTGWVNTVGNNCMHLSNNETANGTKTFTAVPIVLRGSYTGYYAKRTDIEYNVTPASNTAMGGIEVQDKNNTWVGRLAVDMSSGGVHTTYLSVRGEDNSINSLALKRNASGSSWAECPTPSSATDNSTKIATTEWVAGHRCTTAATTTSTASINAPAYIVQNYKNGKSWYRVWSDGWIEQGGYKSSSGNVTLLKTMTDTDFSLQVTADDTSNSSIDCSGKINSTSEIKLNIPGDSDGAWWRVSGY